VEFQISKAEIQWRKYSSISAVSINDILTVDIWDSEYEPHFVVKLTYLLVTSNLKIIKPAHLKLLLVAVFVFDRK
jgi:hypothetical protein